MATITLRLWHHGSVMTALSPGTTPVRACDDPAMTISWPIQTGSLSNSNSVGYISGNQRKTATRRVPNATVWLAAIEEMTLRGLRALSAELGVRADRR